MSTLAKASRAAPFSLIAKAVRFVLSFATSILVVRMLPENEYGVLTIVRTIASLAGALIGFGMGNAILRFLPERETRGEGARALLNWATLLPMAAWAAVTGAAFLLRDTIDGFYGTPIGMPLLAGIALLSGNLLYTILMNTWTATFRTRELALVQSLLSFAILGASYGALRMGWGVIGVLAASSLPYLVAAIIRGPAIWLSLRACAARLPAGPLLAYSIPVAFVDVLNQITWRQSETILLGHYTSAAAAGTFDIAYKLPQLLVEFVPDTIWPLVLAAFAEVYTRDRSRLDEMIRRYYKVLFLLVLPVSVFGVLYGDLLIQTAYGAERAEAGQYARVFFFIFHLTFWGTPLSMALYMLKKTHVNLWLALIAAAVNVGLDFVLIPQYGLRGAVPPVAIAVALTAILRGVTLRRMHGALPIPWGFLGRAYMATAPLAIFYPIRDMGSPTTALCVISGLSLLLLPFTIKVARLLGDEEREYLKQSGIPGREFLLRWFR